MSIRIGKEAFYIKKVKDVLMVIALIGEIVLALSGLLIYYCVINVIPLLNDIMLRTIAFASYISASIISSIIGSHLLIDAIIVSRDIESKLRLTSNGDLKMWKIIPLTSYGRMIVSYIDTLLSRYYDYYLRMNSENSSRIQGRRDMRRCNIWLKIM